MSVSLEASDNFSKVCGYARPNETVSCSQGILRSKLEKMARDYCGNFTIGPIRWQGTSGALFNRSTSAEAQVTCLGLKE